MTSLESTFDSMFQVYILYNKYESKFKTGNHQIPRNVFAFSDTSRRMSFLQSLNSQVFPSPHLHLVLFHICIWSFCEKLSKFFAHCRYLLNVSITEFQITEKSVFRNNLIFITKKPKCVIIDPTFCKHFPNHYKLSINYSFLRLRWTDFSNLKNIQGDPKVSMHPTHKSLYKIYVCVYLSIHTSTCIYPYVFMYPHVSIPELELVL